MVVTEGTARVDVFQEIFSLINTNKLTGTTVLATFPEKSPTFPCYVINSAEVLNENISMDRTTSNLEFNMDIEFFADARDGMQKIDQMKDNVVSTLRDLTNIASLKTAGISMSNIEDRSNLQSVFRNMKINTGRISLTGELLI